MTRRARGGRRPLTVSAYIARATSGLPRHQRLETAAELRAHLHERTREFQAAGYPREEAEFLAVQGMGDPAPTNRHLLGHLFTTPLGWGMLAATVLGLGGYAAWREWLPPRVGVHLEQPTPADYGALFAQAEAPRGRYQAATLTYPAGTRSVVTLLYSSAHGGAERLELDALNVSRLTEQNIRGRVPGSFRHQERWLWTTAQLGCSGEPHARISSTRTVLKSPFRNSGQVTYTQANFAPFEVCTRPNLALERRTDPLAADLPPALQVKQPHRGLASTELRLNHWTVLERLMFDPENPPNFGGVYMPPYGPQTRETFLAVLPLEYEATNRRVAWGGGSVQFGDGLTLTLPTLARVGERMNEPFPALLEDELP